MERRQNLEAFGDEAIDDGESDFAAEHDDTAVDEDITHGRADGEEESPRGWDGMDREGTP